MAPLATPSGNRNALFSAKTSINYNSNDPNINNQRVQRQNHTSQNMQHGAPNNLIQNATHGSFSQDN